MQKTKLVQAALLCASCGCLLLGAGCGTKTEVPMQAAPGVTPPAVIAPPPPAAPLNPNSAAARRLPPAPSAGH